MFPFLIGVYEMPNGRSLLKSHFNQEWDSLTAFGVWCGEATRLGGDKAMNVHMVALHILGLLKQNCEADEVDEDEE